MVEGIRENLGFYEILQRDKKFSCGHEDCKLYYFQNALLPRSGQDDGDRFWDTGGRFFCHERRARSNSTAIRRQSPNDRKANSRGIQLCWVCLPQESWDHAREGNLRNLLL